MRVIRIDCITPSPTLPHWHRYSAMPLLCTGPSATCRPLRHDENNPARSATQPWQPRRPRRRNLEDRRAFTSKEMLLRNRGRRSPHDAFPSFLVLSLDRTRPGSHHCTNGMSPRHMKRERALWRLHYRYVSKPYVFV